MKRFDLYGARSGSLDEVREAIERRLGREFVLHESSYVGGEYFRVAGPPEEILIQAHIPDDEGYFAEPDFQEWSVLVYVNDSTRWDEVDALLANVKLLHRLRTETV